MPSYNDGKQWATIWSLVFEQTEKHISGWIMTKQMTNERKTMKQSDYACLRMTPNM